MVIENVIFEDKVKSSPIVIAVLGLSVITVIIIGIVIFLKAKQPVDNVVIPVLVGVALMDVAVLWLFRIMQIKITDKYVSFGFYFLKKTINFDNIDKVEIEDFKFSNYYGYGIRYGLNNTVGYVPCGGRGIKLTVKSEKRKYFFICNKVEEAAKILNQYVRK